MLDFSNKDCLLFNVKGDTYAVDAGLISAVRRLERSGLEEVPLNPEGRCVFVDESKDMPMIDLRLLLGGIFGPSEEHPMVITLLFPRMRVSLIVDEVQRFSARTPSGSTIPEALRVKYAADHILAIQTVGRELVLILDLIRFLPSHGVTFPIRALGH